MNKLFRYLFITIFLITSAIAEDTVLKKVSLQLSWKHQFEFAGFYMAKEKGFYKNVGLDVEIKEFTKNVNTIDDVLKQKSTFAISYPGVIFKDIQNTVLLSSILQSSPHVLVSLKSSSIHTIKDFTNKKMMISKDELQTASFISMLKSANLSFDDFQIKEHSFNIQSLISGDVDIASYYSSNELYELDKRGIAYNVWNPTDYGFDFYNNILFTSKAEVEQHPDEVKNFNEASLRGWEYAYSHVTETVAVIMKHYNTQNKTEGALLYEAKVLKDLSYKGTAELGNINKSKIQRIIDIFNLLGITKIDITPDSFIYKATKKYYLTEEEKNYLKNKNITMCIDPNWMPFEKFKQGEHVGMSADFFKILKKQFHINTKIIQTKTWDESMEYAQSRKCDILSLVMSTPSREKYLKFTTPYLKIPLVIATKADSPFVANFYDLQGKKIGISKGYAFVELLRLKYPKLNLIEVQNINDGLKQVKHNRLYGYIGTLATIGYAFQNNFTGELKIAGRFDGTWDLGIGVRDDEPLLFSILQKAVNSVDENTKQKIINEWLSIKYVKGTDYNLIFKIIGIFLLILIIISYFYIKLQKLNNKIHKQNIELKEREEHLNLLASTDPLTKLYNRRYFSEISEHILELAKREQNQLSIIMVDIDNFKNINDTYGHKVGDEVIISLASLLVQMSRKSDISCRFGGEEFILLLPQTAITGAYIIAEKIRKTVQKNQLETSDRNTIQYTISSGVSQVDLLHDNTIEFAIKRADDALYEAKRTGRNKTCTQE